jgi:hypothetical protein
MADVTLKILKEADTFDLLKLSEAKTILNIPSGDVSLDDNLKWMITANSALISTMTNRIFGRERLVETWRELGSNRIFLTHWPVKESEIEEVKAGSTVLSPTEYVLEERSGKLSVYNGGWIQPVSVTYTGGYDLPDDAHPTLKYATGLLVGKTKKEQASAALTGVRMIAHKEARVMFHNPATGGGASSGTSDSATDKAVESLLYHFIRHWV